MFCNVCLCERERRCRGTASLWERAGMTNSARRLVCYIGRADTTQHCQFPNVPGSQPARWAEPKLNSSCQSALWSSHRVRPPRYYTRVMNIAHRHRFYNNFMLHVYNMFAMQIHYSNHAHVNSVNIQCVTIKL